MREVINLTEPMDLDNGINRRDVRDRHHFKRKSGLQGSGQGLQGKAQGETTQG